VGKILLGAAVTLTLAACGSDNEPASGGAEPSADVPAETIKRVENLSQPATKITAAELGPYEPKPGAKIVNISCDVSIVGCNAISNGIKSGVEALGYDYMRCDIGKSPDGPNKCFTQAINSKPDVIVVNAVGLNIAADGYAAADKAGIPVVGLFTGDDAGEGGVETQVGNRGCYDQGTIVADAVAVQSEGKANVLFVTEDSIGCDVARYEGFKKRFPTACPDCTYDTLKFNAATLQKSLPQQMQAELNKNPNLNWIVGVFDGVAAVANTQVRQAGKQDQISVAGMDADPANIEVMLNKGIQKIDVAFAFAETPWAAADVAARIYSGEEVPEGLPANIFLVNQNNTDQLPESKVWPGPTDYKEQFKALRK